MPAAEPEPLSYLAAVLLGIVQGATEFLPISSSGHLALAQQVGLGYKMPMLFDLLLHLATVIAVFKAFWKDFWTYLTKQRSVVAWIVLACIPTGVGGMLLKNFVETLGEYPEAVCALLLVTANILMVGDDFSNGDRPLAKLGVKRSLAVGTAQILALAPGVSRSGTTIVAGLVAGLPRDDAVKFSFGLMVPAVLGASFLEILSAVKDYRAALAALAPDAAAPSLMAGVSFGPCAAGFVAALVSGVASLSLLRLVVEKRKLPVFAGYCAAVGVVGMIYFIGFN